MKNVRQVTKSVDPREHALWTVGELYARLREWAYQVYDTQEHAALGQTPEAAFTAGLLQGGMRPNRLIPYDDDFILSTFPTTSKGTAKVQPNLGVKIKYLYYWARGDTFRDPEVERTQVPVRYDPYDVGHAYTFVKGRWVECISEYYARFKGRSERELQLATEELRQRNRHHAQQFTITATKLADFITSVEAQEVLMAQRQRDEEARTVFALMKGRSAPVHEVSVSQGLQGSGTKQGGTTTLSVSSLPTGEIDGSADDDDIYEDF
jgi:hypothetical protein